jgi:ATP-binding cassette, subfamily C, bacterial CydD
MPAPPNPNTTHLHRRLLAETRTVPSLRIGIGLSSLLTASITVGQMYCLSQVINGAFLLNLPRHDVMPWLHALLGFITARALLLWITEIIAQHAAARIKAKLRTRLFQHVLLLGPAWTNREQSGELVSTAVDGIEKLDDYFARFLPASLSVAIVPITIVACVLTVDWVSGLVLCLTGPLIPIFMVLIGKRAESATRNQWEALSRLGAHFLDVLQGLKTLKVFGQSQTQGDRIRAASDRYRIATMRVLRVAFLSGFVLELAASISTAVVAVEVGVRLIQGLIQFQPGLFVLLLAPEFYLPFRTLGARHHAGMEGVAAADRIYAILDAQPLAGTTGETDLPPSHTLQIRIRQLSYSYPGSAQPALHKLTTLIPPGQITALAGPSGAGKSTLVNLLLRFLDAPHGDLLLNEIPLQSIHPHLLRQQIALVPQHPHLFNGSILDNLRLAHPSASDETVLNASQQAGAHSFILTLPNQQHTLLGDNGARLSGGERQRLAMARAFLKNAPLLILDEPASALDPESEAAIHQALLQLAPHRTVLIIAHRLATLRMAHHILLLDHGRLVAEGTHDELQQSSPLYAKLTSRNQESQP